MYGDTLTFISSKAKEHGIPYSGLLELTSKCNLKCKFCYLFDRTVTSNERPQLSTSEWLDLIKQATDAGMLECSLTGGDPFMREDFEEIYCKAYDMGLRLSILTNGVLISSKHISYLTKRLPDNISITIYGASEKTYEKICGNGEDFSRLIAALEKLKATGLPYYLKTLALKPLISEYESMIALATKFDQHIRFYDYICSGRDYKNNFVEEWRVPVSDIPKIRSLFYKTQDNIKFYKTQPETKITKGILCGAGKCGFSITHNGVMLPCPLLTCFETYPLIDGFERSWNILKEKIQRAEICEECHQCNERNVCRKCAAQRLQESGDIRYCSPYIKKLARISVG